MHYKLFRILSFTINYYYHNYIKILLYRYSVDGSTMHICRRDLFVLCLTSGSGWALQSLAGLLRLEFLVPAYLLVNYISSPHRKFRSSSGFSSTTLRRLHVSSFLLVCWTDSLVGYLWCTVTDVLFAHILSSCASSTSCANWSYCTMLCTMRYDTVSYLSSDVM